MKIPVIRAAVALLVATASAAHVPVAPAGSSGATERASTFALPIYVDMECQSAGGGAYTCQASAGGGTGTGFSYAWSNSNGSTWEYYDQDGYSEAEVACYGGLGQGSTALITATVTDSNGATGSRSRIINCGY
jgi:hypothetical protein